jgi:hypothetical protein
VDDWYSLNRNISLNDSAIIIALDAELQVYLKKNDIAFENTIPFFNKASHEQITKKSAEISRFIRDEFNLKDEFGLSEGYNNYFTFYLHFYINQIFFLLEIILNANKFLDISEVVVCSPRRSERRNIIENEYYKTIPQIIEAINDQLNISVSLHQVNNNLKVLIYDMWFDFKKNIARCLMIPARYILKLKTRGLKLVFASSKKYNLGILVDNVLKRQLKLTPIYLNNSSVKSFFKMFSFGVDEFSLISPWCILSPSRRRHFKSYINKNAINLSDKVIKNKRVFNYRDVSLVKLFFLYSNGFSKQLLYELYVQTCAIDKMLVSLKPNSVISQMALGWTYQLGELASNNNISSLLISHGSHVDSSSIYAQMEWKEHSLALTHTNYSHTVVQSPMAKQYFKVNQVKSKLISTGPLLFSRLDKEKVSVIDNIVPGQEGKFIIMHAGSARGLSARRFVVYETVDEYIANINSLIRAVIKIGAYCHLIIRFRPNDDLSLEALRELLIPCDNYSICTEGSFGQYLEITDVMVSYSSTTIDEALYNQIPVILFDSDNKYKHIPHAVDFNDLPMNAQTSCCYAVSEKELEGCIRWFKDDCNVNDIKWDESMIESNSEKLTPLFE